MRSVWVEDALRDADRVVQRRVARRSLRASRRGSGCGSYHVESMSAPRRRTPPEKKNLALARDGLSSSDPWAIGVKRKKKRTTRANRHAVKQALRDPERDVIPKRKQVADLRPSPEAPTLKGDIEWKRQRRAPLEQNPAGRL
jgi:hypothetical protein